MGNKFLNLFKNKKIVFLFILLVLVLIAGLSYKLVEGFDLGGLTSGSSSSTSGSKSIPQDLENLAPLPDGYAWSTEMQDKWIAYGQKQNPNNKASPSEIKTQLASVNPQFGGKSFMQLASEKEVQYYMDNGAWPIDEYVTNYFNSLGSTGVDQLKQFSKQMPNRFLYMYFVEGQTVPQIKMITNIFNSSSFTQQTGENGDKWYCEMSGQNQWDFKLVNSAGETSTLTDYNKIPEIIKDFSFEGDPCNICGVRGTGKSGSFLDVYNSDENKCKFKMTGEVPEAYNVFVGKYGNAPTDSSPASTTPLPGDNDYKKCVAACG